ncbi:MAG: tyrosine--tRNA ligase [Armatimonadota bacterium]|nr:tyrosine--tRNA ligase [Armatimonadota bacterium]
MQINIEKQLELIKRGAADIAPEEELKQKFVKSQKENRPLRVKLGIDPTAPDIHLGFAVVLRKMRQFQDLGHEVILIVGDFTASIGDPSGKSETRPMLNAEQIRANAETFTSQFWQILDRSKTTLTFNGDWLGKMTFGDVVKETSKVTVARILERDDFQKRLSEERPIGLHELLYPIAQALDSVEIKADIEIGGTDQRFNILMGRDLQENHGQEPQVGLFMPLLPGLDGVQKMSKSLGNYIGITEAPKDMFGKAMSIPDDVMPMYYELATNVPMDEVRQIEQGISAGTVHPMEAKKRLAFEITKIYHSEEAARAAQEEFERVFSQRETPTEIPEAIIPGDQFRDGKIWIVRLLTATCMAKSNGEARRLVEQGGVTLDGERIDDMNAELQISDGQILRAGKLRFARLKVGK